jgi:hypothetical protein
MRAKTLPADPTVQFMITWVAESFSMTPKELAVMFQTSPATIARWSKEGSISDTDYAKLRRSFYFLNNTADPHVNERKCSSCRKWKPMDDFDGDVCLSCS